MTSHGNALAEIATTAKDLARRYYQLTGKPLGVTGELAELEAARILNLKLAPARQAGWDASRILSDGRTERLQIKGRWMVNGRKPSAKLGRIDIAKPFDAVLLVLLDKELTTVAIHWADVDAVRAALQEPGSKGRNERGQLTIRKFISIGRQLWSAEDGCTEKASANREPAIFAADRDESIASRVVPIGAILRRLCEPKLLAALCGPRDDTRKVDRREHLLEAAVRSALVERFGLDALLPQSSLGRLVPNVRTHHLSSAVPDAVLALDGSYHVYEVKSNRVDYNRHHREPGQPWFQEFLGDIYDRSNGKPTEVEQDLIRLRCYSRMTPKIGCGIFIMVDAFAGSGLRWSTVFTDASAFREKMRTPFIQSLANEIVARSHVIQIPNSAMDARLIVCDVPSA